MNSPLRINHITPFRLLQDEPDEQTTQRSKVAEGVSVVTAPDPDAMSITMSDVEFHESLEFFEEFSEL